MLVAAQKATLKGGDRRILLDLPAPGTGGGFSFAVVKMSPKPPNLSIATPVLETFMADKPLKIIFPFHNAGQSNAQPKGSKFTIVVTSGSDVHFDEVINSFQADKQRNDLQAVIGAGMTVRIHNTFNEVVPQQVLVDDVFSGKIVMYLLGEVVYSLGPHQDHRLWFSFEYDPKDKVFRPTGNYQGSE